MSTEGGRWLGRGPLEELAPPPDSLGSCSGDVAFYLFRECVVPAPQETLSEHPGVLQ